MVFAPKAAFITGGGTGIGRALAQEFHRRGIKVVIAGRREDVLKAVADANPGMQYVALDVTKPDSIKAAWQKALQLAPELDCVVNNAGMQRMHDFAGDKVLDLTLADAELDINLRGPIMVTAATLPHLKKQQSAYLINISSGLSFVPLADRPVYCATKAAIRSFTISLRHQLAATSVKVVEIAPPAVQTELHDYMGEHGKSIGIPVSDFVKEAMAGLDAGEADIAVAQAKLSKGVIQAEAFDKAFKALNSAHH